MRSLWPRPRAANWRRFSPGSATAGACALLAVFSPLAVGQPENNSPKRHLQGAVSATSRDALLHHQPDPTAVAHLQIERFGRAQAERQWREAQSEIDRIYREVMIRSDPANLP